MPQRRMGILAVFFAAVLLAGCSSTPREKAEKHARRGAAYFENGRYKEALVEYLNAAREDPGNGMIRWKLAQAALAARDYRTAVTELRKTVELDPGNAEALGRLGEIYLVAGRAADAGEIADNLIRSRPGAPDGYLLKSGVSLQARRIDDAIAHMKTASGLAPGKARPMVAVANLYLIKRDAGAAREWLDRALAAEPGSPEVHLARGNLLFAMGDREGGEESYRKAVELSREKESVRIMVSEQYLAQGRLEDAVRELEALIRDSDSRAARKVLAETLLEAGRAADAAPVVEEIRKAGGSEADASYLTGRIAFAQGRYGDARGLFEEAIRKDPAFGRAHLYNGIVHVIQGRIEEGKREVAEAIRLDPSNVKARLVHGELHLRTNAPAEAEKEAIEVLRRNPSSVTAAVLYGDTFLLRRNWAKAEEVYQAIIRQRPDIAVGYAKMGIARRMQMDPAGAAAHFEKAHERRPGDAAVLEEYVGALVAGGQADKAKRAVDARLSREPENPVLWVVSGRTLLAMRRTAEAESAFLKAIELRPDDPRPYFDLGLLYAAQRKLPEAEKRFRAVIEANERNERAHALLGLVLNGQNRIGEANRHYRRVLELNPRNALAANNLASNLSEHGGNLDEALRFAQTARELAPGDPSVADTLGWIYYKKGYPDSAYPLIAEARAKLAGSPVIRYHHGMVLAQKGNRAEAAAELKAALEKDASFPGADEARRTLEALRKG